MLMIQEAQFQEPLPQEPLPMHKEETIKDDGRYLIYYTFPQAEENDV